MHAAAADRGGIESGCEPAGLARRGRLLGVGLGAVLAAADRTALLAPPPGLVPAVAPQRLPLPRRGAAG